MSDDCGRQVEEDLLQINDRAILGRLEEVLSRCGFVDFWQDFLNKGVKVGAAEELQTGFALGSPQVTGGIDDAVSCWKGQLVT
jgi:hypothetical protein